ncbi:MAG: hypothetical protein HFJ26_09210 [Clostridia bacterium]|nr:hypothetical protein [Clostridia bacterium]
MKIKEISDVSKMLTEISNMENSTKKSDKEELLIINLKNDTKEVAFDVISNVLQKTNKPIAIFSSKVKKKEIINKILSDNSNIDDSKIESGQINSEEWDRLTKIIETLSQKEIYIDDTIENLGTEIINKSKELKEKKDIRIVIWMN